MLHVSVIKGCECPDLHTLSTGPSPKRLPGAIDRRYPRAAGGWCSELTGRDPPTKHKSGEETNPFNPNSTLFVKAPPNSATSFSPLNPTSTVVLEWWGPTHFSPPRSTQQRACLSFFLTATSRTVGPRPWFHFLFVALWIWMCLKIETPWKFPWFSRINHFLSCFWVENIIFPTEPYACDMLMRQ